MKTKFPAFLLLSCCTLGSYAQSARALHDRAIVVDTHGDIMFNQVRSGIDIGQRQATGNFDLVRAKEGGLDVQVFSIWCDHTGGYALANRQIDSLQGLIKRYPDRIAQVVDAAGLEQVVASGKMAALFGVEGGHMIENRLDYVDSLAKRGMTYLTLTWNNSTPWASSAAEEVLGKLRDKAGLNVFGKKVVKRLNKLGVMVDLSHVGEQTFYDAVKASTKPVIASHSSVYTLNAVPRNLKDNQLKEVAKSGGVVFVNFYSGFIDSAFSARQKGFFARYDGELKELTAKYGRGNATDTLIARHQQEADDIRPKLSVLIDHIDYLVRLIGPEHVGLGADFDGAESYPRGINSVADYPLVTEELLKRGYSEKNIRLILGENFIRVLKANKGS
jgi:membrane dipeptidase